jgi:hypothetical protein
MKELAVGLKDELPALPRCVTWCATLTDWTWSSWSHYEQVEMGRGERLVPHPKDWLGSSFSFYAYDAPGLIRIDRVD